jgi:hypothetical protein
LALQLSPGFRLLALPLERRLRIVIQYLREETGSAAG